MKIKVLIVILSTLCGCSILTPKEKIDPSLVVNLPNAVITESQGNLEIQYQHSVCLLESKETKTVNIEYKAAALNSRQPSILAKAIRGILEFIGDVLFL